MAWIIAIDGHFVKAEIPDRENNSEEIEAVESALAGYSAELNENGMTFDVAIDEELKIPTLVVGVGVNLLPGNHIYQGQVVAIASTLTKEQEALALTVAEAAKAYLAEKGITSEIGRGVTLNHFD